MRALRIVSLVIGGLVALAILAVVAATLLIDPNRYKPEIVKMVKEKTGRTLAIDGRIHLTFFPHLGAAVDGVTLSERSGTATFAKVGEARASVGLWPLLSRQVVVNRVELIGIEAALVRRKDGTTNFDDLVGKQASKPAPTPAPEKAPAGGEPVKLDVSGIEIRDANVSWRDELEGIDLRLSKVNVRTGRIASGVPGEFNLSGRMEGTAPNIVLDVSGKGGYRLDLEKNAFSFTGLHVGVKGDAPGAAGLDATLRGDVELDPARQVVGLSDLRLEARTKEGLDATVSAPKFRIAPEGAASEAVNADLKIAKADRTVTAKIALSSLTAKGRGIRFERLGLDADVKQGDYAMRAKLATPVVLDVDAQTAELPTIAGDLAVAGPNVPGKEMKGTVTGDARASWGKRETIAAALVARIDETTARAKVNVAGFTSPAIEFNVNADKVNVDRYLPSKSASASPSNPAAGSTSAGGGGAPPAGEDRIDLSALKSLKLVGDVRVGDLVASNLKAQNVHVGVRAAGGKLDVAPITASLYQGSVNGSASVDANANRFATRQQLTGISVGPLLRDLAKRDVLEGRGNVSLDVQGTGDTASAIKRSLAGAAAVNLRDGAVKGVNLAETVRQVKAMLGSKSALEQQAKGGQQTDFSELKASFVIRNGVAHNEDLDGRSPFLRLGGRGDIDIGAGTIDYLAQVTVVGTSKGQGGKDLQDLEGLTIPVRLTGPFEQMAYSVDVGAVATELAKREVTRQLEKQLGGGKPGSPSPLDALRGLFRK